MEGLYITSKICCVLVLLYCCMIRSETGVQEYPVYRLPQRVGDMRYHGTPLSDSERLIG